MKVAIARDSCMAYTSAPDVRTQEEVIYEVEKALSDRKHEVKTIDCSLNLNRFLSALADFAPDAVFNLCESVFGDPRKEHIMPAILKAGGFKVTGSNSMALILAGDKFISKSIMRSKKISVPDFTLLGPGESDPERVFFPAILKPCCEHASTGINENSVFYENPRLLTSKAGSMSRELGQPVILEKFIEGREISLSLIGNKRFRVLPPSEVKFCGGFKILSYRGKWAPGTPEYENTLTECPALIDSLLLEKISRIAQRAALAHSCSGYARVDLRIDKNQCPFVIDVNPNPDLARGSGFARSAEAGGISYGEVLEIIVRSAL